MRIAAFTLALLLGGAAFAQTDSTATTDSMTYDGDGVATAAFETEATMTAATDAPAATGQIVQPGNVSPEHDARGIAVISDAAFVPAGWNGTPADTAMGGPLLDPVTGEPVVEAQESYPACTATVTDNCLQTYEKGRKAS